VHPQKKGNEEIPMSTQSQDAAEDYTGASYPDYAKDAGACTNSGKKGPLAVRSSLVPVRLAAAKCLIVFCLFVCFHFLQRSFPISFSSTGSECR
jgi:hypothetical protein